MKTNNKCTGPKYEYVFVHLGKCMENVKEWNPYPDPGPYKGDTWKNLFETNFDWGGHVKRIDFWEKGVRERLTPLKQTPFVPHRWPAKTTTPSFTVAETVTGADETGAGTPAGGKRRPLGPHNHHSVSLPDMPTPPAHLSPPGPDKGPPAALRESRTQHQPLPLSELIQAWQDYLRVLR